MEEYCRGQSGDFRFFVERRENQYRNENIERTRIIKPSELMKVVAAMYLYQPHRAARDFRRIRTEYDDKVFQEEHDIIPYHLACYASYKFDFCIKNSIIARERSIFKYYILFFLGFIVSNGRKLLEIRRLRDLEENYSGIRKLLADETSFISLCGDISNLIDKTIVRASPGMDALPIRERVRDLLRKETFVQIFQEELQEIQPENLRDVVLC